MTMIDTTLSSFERDVVQASSEVPVLVGFWAPWSGPCRQLGPLLERLERESGGRFRLVNVNADTNPELVASFELKSLPHTFAFVDGNAVAQFSGIQPEAFVRAFLERLVPDPAKIEHRAAREALARGQAAIAEECLRNAIALDPSNDAARLDVVRALLGRGDVHGARAHFDTLSGRAAQHSTYATVREGLERAEAAVALPPEALLEQRVRCDHGDLQARFELAQLQIAQRDYAPALEQLLEIVRRDRHFQDDVARRSMLAVFDMAAGQPDLVSEFRSRLSSVLF
jgi:putative thioredoxin